MAITMNNYLSYTKNMRSCKIDGENDRYWGHKQPLYHPTPLFDLAEGY